MAITKIHAITASVPAAINYICNDQKTNGGLLISSFATSPITAKDDFRYALSHTRQSDPNKAFHLIQSFAAGEVTSEEAHRIGIELADRLLKGEYSYVISTHIDKKSVHNHIIFCAANNLTYRKYHDCKATYRNIRNISDSLCREHSLSVLEDKSHGGRKYKEWSEESKGQSWKTQLKNTINETIEQAGSYEEFIILMRKKGYEIKDEDFGADSHKYIAFRAPGQERWTRGREKSLGAEFTKERIKERIENRANGSDRLSHETDNKNIISGYQNNLENGTNSHNPEHRNTDARGGQTSEIKSLKIPDSLTRLIDISQDKFAENPYLKTWAEKQNLKTAAQIYSKLSGLGLQSMTDLDAKITELHEQTISGRRKVVELDRKLKDLKEVLAAATRYSDNRKYLKNYTKSKDKERYYQSRHYELHIAWGAEEILKGKGIDPGKLDLQMLQDKYDKLTSERTGLINEYRSAEKQCEELKKLRDGLTTFMNNEISSIREKDKNKFL